mgnify:CR=1 FL=1
MCDPISIGLGVASGAMQYQGQRQAAKTQAIMQRRASEQESKRYLAQVSAMRTQERFQKIEASQKLQANQKRAQEARATARVASGEAGVSGLSIDAIINDYTRKEGQYNFSVEQNLRVQQINSALGLDNAGQAYTSNMLRINQPIKKASFGEAILTGAQTGFAMSSAVNESGLGDLFSKPRTTTPLKIGAADLAPSGSSLYNPTSMYA